MGETPVVVHKTGYHHGDLRAQLLEAVRGLLETHGPDGFSIAEACRLAGVSTAAPYKHFKDREDILRAVVAAGMERLRTRILDAGAAHSPRSVDRIAAIGKAYIDFARAEPGVFQTIFGLAKSHKDDPDLKAMGDATFGFVVGVVAEFLGRDPSDPEIVSRAYALWSVVHGHSFLVLDGKFEPEKLPISEERFLQFTGAAILNAAD